MSAYYLSIEQPSMLRKELLESAKDSVQILKSQYGLRDLRVRKMEALSKFADTIDEIGLMIKKIEDAMPEHDDKNMPEVAREIEKKMKKRASTKVKKVTGSVKPKKPAAKSASKKAGSTPKRQGSETDRAEKALSALEDKLSAIESKLNKL